MKNTETESQSKNKRRKGHLIERKNFFKCPFQFVQKSAFCILYAKFLYFVRKATIGQQKVGAIRIIDKKENGKNKRISPIFVLPEFQGKGIAQRAIRLCEKMHGNGNWELDTILQEPKNCYLYEKMGYRQTGKTTVINERLTLTFYEK